MIRFMFFVFFLVIVWGDDARRDEIIKLCGKVFQGGFGCCKRDLEKIPERKLDVDVLERKKLCAKLPMTAPACELQICTAAALGIGFPDGSLDKTNLTVMIEQEFADINPEMLGAVKEKCTYGDLSLYGFEKGCVLSKWEACLQIQMIGHCPKWDNEGRCKGMEEAADKCYQLFP